MTYDAETKVRIYDLEGRHVITIFDSRFDGAASSVPETPAPTKPPSVQTTTASKTPTKKANRIAVPITKGGHNFLFS